MQVICPKCKLLTTWEENAWRPFCSERCKMADLGGWFSEDYVIEGKPEEEEDESENKEEDV